MRLPWRTLVVAAVALAAAAFPGSLESLALDREALAAGQIWRLATGHLVHGSQYHLALDLAAWVLAGLLFEPVLGRRYWMLLAVSAVFIDVGFLLLQPDLAAYCGLSGVLNGIMVGGAVLLWRLKRSCGDNRQAAVFLILLVAILGKITVEGLAGAPLFTEITRLGATPVPLAHALGALGATLVLPRTRLPTNRNITINV